MRKGPFFFLLILFFLFSGTSCQRTEVTNEPADTAMSSHQFSTTAGGTIGYWLYTPPNATAGMPLIVYLHGGSGRGSDLNLVVASSLPQFLKDGSVRNIPAYILMPQCPANKTWEGIGAPVKELIENVAMEKQIHTRRVSLTGYGLGGSGTWSLGATYAPFFSCLAPLSGSVDPAAASSYLSTPVWAFAGSADTVVDPAGSQLMVAQINSQGGNAQIKVYTGATHFEVPALAYKDGAVNLLNWMISHSK